VTAEVRSVVVKLSMENAQYIAGAIAAGDAQVQAQTRAKAATMSSGQAMDSLGTKAGRVGAGAAVALGLMAKAAMDWESQWAGVTKTVDGTGEELNELEGDLRDLATSLPATHEEIAGVAEAAGQLGVAREDIAEFTKTMVDLGETTNLTAEGAATDIAQISNVMGTGADDVDNLGSALVALGNDGASTEAQILGMAQRIAGAGAQIGLAESDILAIANAAASMGIEVEAGGSAISRVFTEMAKATAQGGQELEDFAGVAGMSADEFVRAFEDDPAQAFAAFTSGLDRINQSGGDVFTTLDQLKLSDVRVSQALLGMAASGDLLTDSLELGSKAWEENTALAAEAEKRYDTTAAKTQVSWNKIKDAGIDAGNALLPVVAQIADGVGAIADAFGELPDPAQGVLTKLLAITAVTGGGLWFGAKVIGAVTSTREALDGLSASGGKSAGAMRGLLKAGIALAGLELAGTIIRGLDDAASGAAPNVQALTAALIEADAARFAEKFGGDIEGALKVLDDTGIDGFIGDLNRLSDQGGATGTAVARGLGVIVGVNDDMAITAAKTAAAEKAFASLDEALTGLVAAGGADRAKAAFDALTQSQGLSSAETDKLLEQLPEYSDALAGAANQEALAAESADEAAEATGELAGEMSAATQASKEQAAALAAVREAADETAASFFDLTADVEGNKKTLSGWIQEMRDQADALTNFTANAIEAGEKGVEQGLINQLRKLGPEGAKQLRWLANASDKEIAAANRAWQRGQDAIKNYTDSITGVPALNMRVQDAEGRKRIKEIQRLVDKFGMTKAEARAFIRDAATDRIAAVQRLVDEYGITKAEATALLRDMASGEIAAVRAALRDLDGDRATTYIDVIRNTVGSGVGPASRGDEYFDNGADGTSVPKDGRPYADRYLYMLAPGEEVISNRHGEADRYRAANGIPGLADGGTVATYARSGTMTPSARTTGIDSLNVRAAETADSFHSLIGVTDDFATTAQLASQGMRATIEERLEIAQAMAGIRDLRRSLAADGKDRLSGLDRKIAQLELQAAEKELRMLRNREEREARQEARDAAKEAREAARERRENLRAIGEGFSLDDLVPDDTPATVAGGMAAEIAQFKADILDAGGTWTRALREWAADMMATAAQYDAVQAQLVEETRKRDELLESLNTQQQALDQLTQTMEAYGRSVASNFLRDPFNGSRTTTTQGPGTTPELEAQRSALAAAEAQLIAIRSGADADSVGSAAAASRLMAQITAMRASIDAAAAQAAQPVETTVTGLQALEETLLADTRAAEAMAAALALLEEKGLDTTGALGGLYQQLAASGDLATAEELAALTEEQIAYYEELFSTRENAAAYVASLATQAVYGEQQAVLVAAIEATTAAIAAQDATMAALVAELLVLGAQVRDGAAEGVATLAPQFTRLSSKVEDIPRVTVQLLRKQGG
jgi:TP901 family phage tail tape measure protein